MALPSSIQDRERDKFVEVAGGYVAVWTQNATAPGYEDDSRDRALVASPLVVTETYNATPYLFTGSAATANIKAEAGVITSFQFRNSGSSHLWIIFNDDANTITGADAAELSFYLAPNSSLVISSDFFPSKQHGFATGIAVGVSSTQATYTAYGTPSEVTGMVMYG